MYPFSAKTLAVSFKLVLSRQGFAIDAHACLTQQHAPTCLLVAAGSPSFRSVTVPFRHVLVKRACTAEWSPSDERACVFQ